MSAFSTECICWLQNKKKIVIILHTLYGTRCSQVQYDEIIMNLLSIQPEGGWEGGGGVNQQIRPESLPGSWPIDLGIISPLHVAGDVVSFSGS